jgi:hypothetical protein
MDIGYTLFGDFTPKQRSLVDCIPGSLKSSAVDLQFGQAIGFLLTRSGRVFYAGQGDAFKLAVSQLFLLY